MRVYVGQNEPFTLMYDSWKAGSRTLVDLDPEKGRHQAEVILASVLSNRKPPYSLAGGLFDTLKASGGDFYTATNNDIVNWLLQFRNREGYDLLPAACVAVTALAKAVQEGAVGKDAERYAEGVRQGRRHLVERHAVRAGGGDLGLAGRT